MAGEIVIDKGDPNGKYDVVFYYEIPSPKTIQGSKVVPTPAETMPACALAEMTGQNPGNITKLDAGDAAFEVTNVKKADGLTNPELIAKLKSDYDTLKTKYLENYDKIYAHVGTTIDR